MARRGVPYALDAATRYAMKPPIPTKRAAEILDCGPREVRRLARLGRIQGASKLTEDGRKAPWVFDPEELKVLPPQRDCQDDP
jgi:hypothetical protein